MRKTLVVGIAALALVAPTSSAASEADSVRHAVTELKSGLRHNDGRKACGRMTLRFRKKIITLFVKEIPSLAGEGCVYIMNLYGREVFEANGKIKDIKINGRCANFRGASTGRKFHSRKVEGRWLYDGPGSC